MKTKIASLIFFVILNLCSTSLIIADEVTTEDNFQLTLDNIRLFTEVFGRIKHEYVDPVDDQDLLENAIRGMLMHLDPHSSYLTVEEYKALEESSQGEFGGIGVEIQLTTSGQLKIIAPIHDSPADKAGVLAGDIIVKIDDINATNLSINEAAKLLHGNPGSEVMLTIINPTTNNTKTVKIIREIIKTSSIAVSELIDNIAYIRLALFQADTADEMNKIITTLQAQAANNKLSGLILDIRNNPGGILDSAIKVADLFLNNGLIVNTIGRIEAANQSRLATAGDIIENVPIIILVNEGSASASEVLAGALQDHQRAIIMGTPTFGKGTIQSITPLPNGAAVKLTTAKYYTPNGVSIQAAGIQPDIYIASNMKFVHETESDNHLVITEANLAGHLAADESTNPVINENFQLDDELIKTDYVLYEAINLLKMANIIKKQ